MKASDLAKYGTGQVVEIGRRRGLSVHGIVAAVGRKWMLVHVADDTGSGGITALRCSDVTTVRIDDDAQGRRSADGIDAQALSAIGLETTAGTLARLSTYGKIVTVYLDDEVVGRVGTIVRVSASKRFEFLPVECHDVGSATPVRMRFSGLRRVDVASGAGHEDAADRTEPPDADKVTGDLIEGFRSAIGARFELADADRTAIGTIRLETIAEHRPRVAAPRSRPFSLLFVGSGKLKLAQGAYWFTSPAGESRMIFIVPVGPGDDARHRYQADFN